MSFSKLIGSRSLVWAFICLLVSATTPALAAGTSGGGWRGATGTGTNAPQTTVIAGKSFDLTSGLPSIAVGHDLFTSLFSTTINVGGTLLVVQAGSKVTAAEFLALKQVLTQGTQSLLLNSQGVADGGSFSLGSIGTRQLASLVVPQGVTASSQGLYSPLTISGLLQTSGQILGNSSRLLSLQAGSVDVTQGGSIVTSTNTPIDLSIYSLSNIVNAGTISASGILTLNALGSIANQSASGSTRAVMSGAMGTNLFSGSGQITNAGLISSANGSVNFNAPANVDLVINNVGGQVAALQGSLNFRDVSFSANQLTAVNGGQLSAQTLNFYGGSGTVNALADEIDGVVNVNAGVANVNASGGNLNIGNWTVTGDPTIANSDGNVNLFGNLTFLGQNLAILASGNVTTPSSGNGIQISTYNTSGNGGSLSILAGFDFTPSTGGQVTNSTTTYTLTEPSATGGSVNLSGANIATGGVNGTGGNVSIYAHSGTLNPGSVTLSVIDTSSRSASSAAGNISIVGQGGVKIIGSINTRGATGGSVSLSGAEPILSGTVTFLNGAQGGTGTIGAGAPVSGAGAGVSVGGTISATASTGNGGDVMIDGDQAVTVGAAIITGGGPIAGSSSGSVTLSSLDSSVVLGGGIFTTGSNVGGGGQAANGGNVIISAASNISINGTVSTVGGVNSGNGAGGDAGVIDLATVVNTEGTTPITSNVGQIVVNGYLDARGGASAGGVGGTGGCICTSSGILKVMGMGAGGSGTVSISVSGGTGGGGAGTNGTVTIDTFGVQLVPTDFNLTSTTKDQFAIPGGLFQVGNSTVNGTKGTIVSGIDVASSTNAGNVLDPGFTVGNVAINVTNSSFTITENGAPRVISAEASPGVRTMVTPGEALALFQVSRDSSATAQQIGLNASGQVTDTNPNPPPVNSNITIPGFEIFQPFTAFNLSTTGSNLVTLNITGLLNSITMPSKVQTHINGLIKFTTAGSNDTINFGMMPVNIGSSTGGITATSNSTLTLVGQGGTSAWVNDGQITAGTINVNITQALTLNMGSLATIGSSSLGGNTSFNVLGNLTINGGTFVDTTANYFAGGTTPFGTIKVTTTFGAGATLGNAFAPQTNTIHITGNLVVSDGDFISGSSLTITSTGLMSLGSTALSGVNLASSLGPITINAGSDLSIPGMDTNINAKQGSLSITSGGAVSIGAGASLSASGPSSDILVTSGAASGITTGGDNSVHAGRDIAFRAGSADSTIGSSASGSNSYVAGRNLTISDQFASLFVNKDGLSTGNFTATTGEIFMNAGAAVTLGAESVLNANSGIDIAAAGGGAQIGNNSNLVTNGGNLSVFASGGTLSIGDSASLTAGTLNPGAPATGVLSTSNIKSKGQILLTALNSNDMNILSSVADPDTFTANGGNISFDGHGGHDINLNNSGTYQANGGNVIMLADHEVNGGSGNNFVARAVGTLSSFTGGGVELGAGVSTSTVATVLANRPPTFTVTPAGLPTGATINHTGNRGVVETNLSGGGVVTLNSGGADSTINVFGGVTIFDADGGGKSVLMNTATFTVNAPIAYRSEADPSEQIVDTGDCIDDDGNDGGETIGFSK